MKIQSKIKKKLYEERGGEENSQTHTHTLTETQENIEWKNVWHLDMASGNIFHMIRILDPKVSSFFLAK